MSEAEQTPRTREKITSEYNVTANSLGDKHFRLTQAFLERQRLKEEIKTLEVKMAVLFAEYNTTSEST